MLISKRHLVKKQTFVCHVLSYNFKIHVIITDSTFFERGKGDVDTTRNKFNRLPGSEVTTWSLVENEMCIFTVCGFAFLFSLRLLFEELRQVFIDV